MKKEQLQDFYIPVMGLAFTIDSPIRVAHLGINSVISIIDDELMEKMNSFYSKKFHYSYNEITTKQNDYRAERIKSYLNLVSKIVQEKYHNFCTEIAENKQSLLNFLETLPQKSIIKKELAAIIIKNTDSFETVKNYISQHLNPGAIDVNIMTKIDKTNYKNGVAMASVFNDAHAALRGFAESELESSLVLSAGMNPSLYNYISEFKDFFPDENGILKKKIILKVSDFRSALIQGNYLAKKGIWVSEYRIESGLNCGGHAFATDGLLLGPIMEEFKLRKEELVASAHQLMTVAFFQKGIPVPNQPLDLSITVQGGVGTAEEHQFLLQNYNVDAVGWGSPFLLVPEATSTDEATRKLLMNASEKDFYRSNISPLGVPFNAIKGTTNEFIKNQRIAKNKAGSSCPKKLLALNTDYTKEGMCTASRKYQQLKLKELDNLKENKQISLTKWQEKTAEITVKSCLCVGLANTAYLENDIEIKGEKQGVVVCPGPNLAYFDKEVSLKKMTRHINGYESILALGYRPNMFIKELKLYVAYLKEEIKKTTEVTKKNIKKWQTFKTNLLEGIDYYNSTFEQTTFFKSDKSVLQDELCYYEQQITNIEIPSELN
jgi:flagellar biosynthesis/type III secretory pathway chaperone